MGMFTRIAAAGVFILTTAAFGSSMSWAQDAGPTATTPGTPTLRPLCTDRPTKSTGACTVDVGHFQTEIDLGDITVAHGSGFGTNTYVAFNPTLKYGVTNTVDVEVNMAILDDVRVKDASTGKTTSQSGIGDLYAKAKLNFLGDDSGNLAVALIPYVKAPTARNGVGNGAWEGGVIVPAAYKLSSSWTLTVDPELDIVKNSAGNGAHASLQQVVDLGWSAPSNVTLYGELWSDTDFDPMGTTTQYSVDFAATLGLAHDSQLDAGVNFGLNKITPVAQAYVGVSKRF